MSCEAFSMAYSIMLPSLSLLFFISYYNICQMSFEFNSKIQNLTSKLQGLQQNSKKQVDLEDVKGQLRKLNEAFQKQLLQADKRIYKIENRLEKCQDYSKRSSRAIENVWNERQEKVSEIIGGWVEQYEEKAEQTRNLLVREEMNYKMKLQGEQEVIAKEMRMEQNRVKDLIHILEREMNKLATINAQNHAAVMKEILSAKQALNEGIANTDQLREGKIREVESRMNKMKQSIKARCNRISEDTNSKSSKLKQVMKLLLDIE